MVLSCHWDPNWPTISWRVSKVSDLNHFFEVRFCPKLAKWHWKSAVWANWCSRHQNFWTHGSPTTYPKLPCTAVLRLFFWSWKDLNVWFPFSASKNGLESCVLLRKIIQWADFEKIGVLHLKKIKTWISKIETWIWSFLFYVFLKTQLTMEFTQPYELIRIIS